MPINDYKEITIPVSGIDKAVKKIEDANGNIIWGSQSAFPYRRLEYIHFNGAEYINTGLQGSSVKWWQIQVSFDSYSSSSDLFCSYTNSVAAARQRFYIGRANNSSKMQFALGSTWSNSTITVPLDNKLTINCRTIQSGNNTTLYFNIKDKDETQLVNSSVASATGTTSSNGKNLFLMANNNNDNGAERFSTGKIYLLIQRNDSSSGTLEFNGIPCQRKSDGVCGLYDTINGVFKPMQGTTTTSSAAGPVIDEYWDLTA